MSAMRYEVVVVVENRGRRGGEGGGRVVLRRYSHDVDVALLDVVEAAVVVKGEGCHVDQFRGDCVDVGRDVVGLPRDAGWTAQLWGRDSITI
jgi:hypothetical protein